METISARPGRISRLIGWIAERHARQSAIRELCRMPGWRLRDMGIDRGRIPEIVDGLLARKRALLAESRRKTGSGPAVGVLDEVTASEAPV